MGTQRSRDAQQRRQGTSQPRAPGEERTLQTPFLGLQKQCLAHPLLRHGQRNSEEHSRGASPRLQGAGTCRGGRCAWESPTEVQEAQEIPLTK